jgi:alkylhydroperoxidase/carboxymuconolactone decarboxylase family protein YurZ
MAEEHLPDVYLTFRERFGAIAGALDSLGEATDSAGPLDQRTARLVKLGLALGAASPGAVRSNTRKALAAGASPDEVRHVAVLAVTTCGFPAAVAGFGWIEDVLSPAD